MNNYCSHYDVHVYFEKDTPSEQEALHLLDRLKQTFTKENIKDFSPHRNPIGPHPTGMWEVNIYDEEAFSKVVPWLCFNHGNLSVLIHPNGYDRRGYLDHSVRPLWLGEKLKLNLSIFADVEK